MKYSLVIPAHNEAAAIRTVMRAALESPADEIIVVDDGSRDDTPEILARFRRQKGVHIIHHRRRQGVGAARRHGARIARGSIVGFFDADIRNARPAMIAKLFRPIGRGKADFVIAKTANRGRVSRFFARQILARYLPPLAHLDRPLCGLFAARRNFLFPHRMESGHAVLGILLDAYFSGAAIEEVDIGRIKHDRKPWKDLIPQAKSELRSFAKRVPGQSVGMEELRAFMRKATPHHA